MKQIFDRQAIGAMILFLLYVLLSFIWFLYTGYYIYLAMIWNLLLAIIPYGLAKGIALRPAGCPRWITAALVLVWLLFFPNAPYMMTDIKHVMYSFEEYSIISWIRLLHIGFGAFLALLYGAASLHLVDRSVFRPKGRVWSALAVAVFSLAGGFGIYLGRFLRFNSWDVLRPISFLRSLWGSLHGFTVQFTLLMGGVILAALLTYRVALEGRPTIASD